MVDDNSKDQKVYTEYEQEKSLDKYGVPMKAQMNVKEKINDLLICEESIYSLKKTFNAKVKSLHMKRLRILEDIDDRTLRVKEIQSELDKMQSPVCYNVGLQIDGKLVLPQLVQISSSCTGQDSPRRYKSDDEMKEKKLLLEYEKSKLLGKSTNSLESFDKSIWVSLIDSFDIIFTTKLEEVRLSHMFLELKMLLGFEDKGKELQRHLEYQHNNHLEVREVE